MLAYAARASRNGERRSSPTAMLIVATAHVAAIAAVMSARMDLPAHIRTPPLIVNLIKEPPPPPPNPVKPQPQHHPIDSHVTTVPPPLSPPDRVDPVAQTPFGGDTASGGLIAGTAVNPLPLPLPPPRLAPIHNGPRSLTPASAVRPPYPPSKLASEEEATLRLRLRIDARGRVIAVDPVGATDPVFLAAARRHLLARWRYAPATDDGRAVDSSLVVTLRFQLDG